MPLNRFRQLVSAVAMAGAAVASTPAGADAYCSAVPAEVFTSSDGMVVAFMPYRGWIGICSVKSVWKSIPTEVCWNWFSTVTTAVTQRKGMGLYYIGLPADACASMETYGNSPAPYYVRISG